MNEDLPKHFIEIYLRPGEFYWGGETTRIQTLLGSCISLTFWHPGRKHGGMCHFMLPEKSAPRNGGEEGRYGTEAMRMFLDEIRKSRAAPNEYQIKMFGGGNMFSNVHDSTGEAWIGANNIDFARRYLEDRSLKIVSEDVGGFYHRKIYFDLWSGHVWVKRTVPATAGLRPERSA